MIGSRCLLWDMYLLWDSAICLLPAAVDRWCWCLKFRWAVESKRILVCRSCCLCSGVDVIFIAIPYLKSFSCWISVHVNLFYGKLLFILHFYGSGLMINDQFRYILNFIRGYKKFYLAFSLKVYICLIWDTYQCLI